MYSSLSLSLSFSLSVSAVSLCLSISLSPLFLFQVESGNGEISQKQANRVRNTLIELKEWIETLSERDTKNNQKLLRNIQVRKRESRDCRERW